MENPHKVYSTKTIFLRDIEKTKEGIFCRNLESFTNLGNPSDELIFRLKYVWEENKPKKLVAFFNFHGEEVMQIEFESKEGLFLTDDDCKFFLENMYKFI